LPLLRRISFALRRPLLFVSLSFAIVFLLPLQFPFALLLRLFLGRLLLFFLLLLFPSVLPRPLLFVPPSFALRFLLPLQFPFALPLLLFLVRPLPFSPLLPFPSVHPRPLPVVLPLPLVPRRLPFFLLLRVLLIRVLGITFAPVPIVCRSLLRLPLLLDSRKPLPASW
jgi:hypothetical protein